MLDKLLLLLYMVTRKETKWQPGRQLEYAGVQQQPIYVL